MWDFRIYSYKYGEDVADVIRKRLEETGCAFSISADGGNCARVSIEKNCIKALADAVCEVILYDFSQFELADMVNELPFSLSMKRDILCSAVGYARKAAMRTPVSSSLYDYFLENDTLVLEGFIVFRMADTREIWERCIERATEDRVLLEEQFELASLICEMADMYAERKRETVLIIRKDGSCTLIDENDIHVDYPDGLGVMNILMSLSPEVINVYDASNGQQNEFVNSLKAAFPTKVCIFNTVM